MTIEKSNRSMGVTVMGWFFILFLGWLQMGAVDQQLKGGEYFLGWFLVVVNILIGIGLLKLNKKAYFGALAIGGLFLIRSISVIVGNPILIMAPHPQLGSWLGLMLPGLVIFIVLLSPKIKIQFLSS